MAFSDHVRDGCVLAAREDVKCAVSVVTERALRVGRSLVADCELLVVESTCAVLENVSFCWEGDTFHIPKSVADFFVNDGQQVLIVSVIARFRVGIPKFVAGVHVGLQVVMQIGQVCGIRGWVVVGVLLLWSFVGQPMDVIEGVPIWACKRDASVCLLLV